jgi:hypothetical protein
VILTGLIILLASLIIAYIAVHTCKTRRGRLIETELHVILNDYHDEQPHTNTNHVSIQPDQEWTPTIGDVEKD